MSASFCRLARSLASSLDRRPRISVSDKERRALSRPVGDGVDGKVLHRPSAVHHSARAPTSDATCVTGDVHLRAATPAFISF